MRSNNTTEVISYVALGLFSLYALFVLGMSGLLFSTSVGLIAFSFMDSVEVATAVVILSGLLFKYVIAKRLISGYPLSTEGFSTDGVPVIAKRVKDIRVSNNGPIGTYSSTFVEGFADADSVVKGKAEGEQKGSDAATTVSKPAETTDNKKKTGEKFTDTAVQQDGLFKLGEIPTESKGGPHIDQGTTLMNAINTLKPDQIQAMTEDTRKLLDTQKNLMSMLNTMKPMLTDGKQLMETFQQMFGPNSSSNTIHTTN